VLRASNTYDITPAEDGTWESDKPTPMFMCPTPIGVRVEDEPIQYDVTFSGDDGSAVAHGTITLVPRCPDENRAFCEKICRG
jgi:hypothetical protein